MRGHVAEQLHLPETEGQEEEISEATPSSALTRSASLRAAIASFEEYMRQQGFAENTSKAFMSDLGILLQFAGAGTAIADISTNRLNQFVHWLRNLLIFGEITTWQYDCSRFREKYSRW